MNPSQLNAVRAAILLNAQKHLILNALQKIIITIIVYSYSSKHSQNIPNANTNAQQINANLSINNNNQNRPAINLTQSPFMPSFPLPKFPTRK